MARAIWKGAISFGLVHIPVSLNVAVSSERVDFDWLDKRSMEPVGYKRVNKVTGKEIDKDNIVKGVEYEKGRYVVISEQEIRDARPEATQTIDIFSFVEAGEIPLQHFDTPYYLSPDRRGGKVYALLRDTLESTGKVALATVVLHTRQHLALLRPLGDALVLITLRWPEEVLARSVAHKLVMHQRRSGGQSQHSELLTLSPKSDRIQSALDYARKHLSRPLSVEELADVVHLSPRQFTRVFTAETGQSPARAVESLRLEAARLMIEQSLHSLDVVARETGFRDRRHMREVFIRGFGVPPQAVRRDARRLVSI